MGSSLKIKVYEDHIEVQLKADIDSLLKTGALPEDAANFSEGTENIENTLIQSSKGHEDKVFRVHVISNGDPLQTTLTRWEQFCFAMSDLAKRNGWK